MYSSTLTPGNTGLLPIDSLLDGAGVGWGSQSELCYLVVQ